MPALPEVINCPLQKNKKVLVCPGVIKTGKPSWGRLTWIFHQFLLSRRKLVCGLRHVSAHDPHVPYHMPAYAASRQNWKNI